jgi:hypothetical protein
LSLAPQGNIIPQGNSANPTLNVIPPNDPRAQQLLQQYLKNPQGQ